MLSKEEIFSKFNNVKKRSENEYMASCPAHNDLKQSLGITFKPGITLVNCLAGCKFEDVIKAAGLTTSDFRSTNQKTSNPQVKRKIIATYDYKKNGVLVHQTVRFEPKGFAQRRPNGKGGWVWSLKGIELILYNHDAIVNSDISEPIFFVEGEKDANNLTALGLLATSCPMGAGKWRKSYNEFLKDRFVYICPDNDKPGMDHANLIAKKLIGKAKKIKIIQLPDLQNKGDISDWIECGGTKEQLLKIIENTKLFGLNDLGNDEPGKLATYPFTDTGAAEMFASTQGQKLRYNNDADGWLYFDGKYWDTQKGEPKARNLFIQTARQLREEALECDFDKRAAIEKYARNLESTNKINNALREARTIAPFCSYATDFDADSWLFNCFNGTIDLRTGELRSHNPNDMLTQIAPVNFAPDAKCPRFETFLKQIFDNNDVLINYVLRSLGMFLTADISEQILPIFYGSGGNGKSVLLDTICGIMGDYATEAAPDLLVEKRNAEHATEIADLLGRRLVIASETEENAKLRIQLIKRLTGNTKLKARYMRQDFFEFDRTHKTILVTNNRPQITEDSNAVWRRIKMIPFNVTIPENKQDKNLLLKLRSEWSGILAKLVNACLEWQKFGLQEPEEIEEATFEYRQEQNPLGEFIEERCNLDSFGVVPVAQLKENYENWLSEKGQKNSLSARKFNDAMRKYGCKYENRYWDEKMQKCWIGIDLY